MNTDPRLWLAKFTVSLARPITRLNLAQNGGLRDLKLSLLSSFGGPLCLRTAKWLTTEKGGPNV